MTKDNRNFVAIAVVAFIYLGVRLADLVFMDLQMPRLDGFEATRHLRKSVYSADDLPIVALTANAYPDDIAACIEASMQDHLTTPVLLKAMEEIVSRFIARETGAAVVAGG